MKVKHSLFLLAFVAVPLAGCDQGDDPTPEARSVDAPKPAPEVQDALAELEPVRTRNGALRFISPQLGEAGAFDALVERFEGSSEAPPVRAALVEAMTRTPDYDPSVLTRALATEPSTLVRAAMATAFVDGGDSANEGIEVALGDQDASVVAAAVSAWGQRTDGARLEPRVIAALDAEDEQVVIAAAGSLALRRVEAARAPLVARLGDERADVRFAAIKALGRIDADYAASLPETLALTGDADDRVARRARRLLDR